MTSEVDGPATAQGNRIVGYVPLGLAVALGARTAFFRALWLGRGSRG